MKITYKTVLLLLFVIFGHSIYGQFQDCSASTKLCDKGTFHFSSMEGMGLVDESQEGLLCSENFKEINSGWLRWNILKSGNLTFVLDPINSEDDLDFVLYRINSDCNDLEEIRCMASGRSYGNSERTTQPCEGRTGLSFESLDDFENSGCKYNDDNYLKFLQTEAGEEYVLFVNNFSSAKGFSITLEGTAEFRRFNSCLDFQIEENINILELFPNPAREEISIIYNKPESKPIEIQILNLQGQVVQSKLSNSTKLEQRENLSIGNLNPGTYLVRINQGKFSSTKRFIKQ